MTYGLEILSMESLILHFQIELDLSEIGLCSDNDTAQKPKTQATVKRRCMSVVDIEVPELTVSGSEKSQTKLRRSSPQQHKSRMEGSVLSSPLEVLMHVKSEEGKILTKPFLDVCKNILPVLDKFGGAFSIVRSDVGGNITRLESKYQSNPSEYKFLYSLVQKEVEAKTEKASSSCTNALLWLTRSMDYMVQMFSNLQEHQDWTLQHACTDSYNKILKNHHGWLASSSFTVAMKLVPERKKFMEVISGSGDIDSDIKKFCTSFSSVLAENHIFLASVGMDNLKA